MKPDASEPLPPIAGYHPTTLLDWPGRLAAIIFLPRCNLRCRFCHAGPLLADSEETIPLEDVLAHVASRRGWLDGMVICGGEPTLWPTLPELCKRLRSAGLAVKLDTNGTFPDRLAALLDAGLLDAVAMDLKAPLDERYRRICGAPGMDLALVERSLDLLMEGRVEYEFRTTLCPAFIGKDEIRAMGASIAGAACWNLQRFEPAYAQDPDLRNVAPYGPAEMEALAEIARCHVARCHIRGQPAEQTVTAR
ncbi:MAG TPA: anaerobic ribonucleoside-triphosphate reductase activating protein [Phycisphaerae bacterium]|nr:anaerobic ribonucleoside-triphosphate reductase activating protein [Phycisphaerae bacterium]